MTQLSTMGHRRHFFDSASPSNIASGVYAAVYVNGFAWDKHDVERMAKVFHVSVLQSAAWARYARCIDIENGAALVIDSMPFVRERRRLGYNDATCYVNRDNWTAVVDMFIREREPDPLYWVATLDGTQVVQGPHGRKAWAVQYGGGMNAPFDTSVLWGVDNFVTP